MLGHNDVVATIPVSDMGRAQKFYEGKLGLIPDGTMGDLLTIYRAGDTRVFVYKTILPIVSGMVVATWAVEDNIEQLAQELLDKGVTLVDFEKEGFDKSGNIYVSQGFKVCLFQDPDGNRLNLFQIDVR